MVYVGVAPPRGVRGLKCRALEVFADFRVAPPRGVRGLKYVQPERRM